MNRKEMFNRFKKPGERENKNYGFIFHLSRYLSFWVTIPFVYLPFTPNQITLLTNILQVSSIFVIAYAEGYNKLYGILIYFIGDIFDFVDGNIARYKNLNSTKGIFYDQIGHVFNGPLFFIGIGIAAYNNNYDILYLYMTIAMAMFVPLMSYQISVSPQYFKNKTNLTSADEFISKKKNNKILYLLKKVVAWFYHFKLEFLFIAILLNKIEILALLFTVYFIIRFFLQLYIDQKNIN